MKYRVNEIFYSLQGEGTRVGSANVFVRFSGCNLTCRREVEGFDCDTEFTSGVTMTGEEILKEAQRLAPAACAVIFTGGEPALQLDEFLVTLFKDAGWYTAVESNGTKELPQNLNWVVISPKTAEHTLVQQSVDELKYVRRAGQGIPKPALHALCRLISPAFQPDGSVLKEDLEWCIALVKENPAWQLSAQLHKFWRIR